jgi:ATP-binding cassette subfamily B protein
VGELLGRREPDRPLHGWSVAPAQARFSARLRASGGFGLAARTVVLRVLQYVFVVTAWAVVGRGALEGRLDPGWLWAWTLILVSTVGCLVMAGWSSGKLAVQLGGLSRERLVEGILGLDPDLVRTQGVGQLLGAVLETEALEALARSGGVLAFMALVQLAAAAVVLALGAAPALTLGAFALWLLAGVALGRAYWRRLVEWADARLGLTHELVENMVGHRTLVAQRGAALAHDEERFAAYERRAAALDRAAARLHSVMPRGSLLVGLAALMPGFVWGTAAPQAMAISLGGMMLVFWSLRQLGEIAPGLAAAALAWKRTRPMFRSAAAAASAAEAAPVSAATSATTTAADDDAVGNRGLLVARDVSFHYAGRPEPALRASSFAIRRGERVLLTGPSGSGKSTLGALLTGLRQPSSGALMLGGFDHHSLGPARWRERSGGVPQFHENHVLCAPLVFNMAMGRGWPPTAQDWREVETICSELGLGPLLARMPAGLQQMVGDSGWQLSHGERSRLYVARSLLQDLDVRVLDESFAALDPETLEQVLDCVLRRTRTLVVVAHV